MGRTAPTYRMLIDAEIERWRDFRKALKRHDRGAFDALMRKTREHASATSYMAPLDYFDCMCMAILLEHEKEIEELKRREGNVSH